jgi:S1-C subfamily serine protease
MTALQRRILVLAMASMVMVTVVAATVGGMVGFAAAMWMAPRMAVQQVSQPIAPVTQAQPSQPSQQPALPAPSVPSAPSGDPVVDAVAKVKPAVIRIAAGMGSGSGVIIDEAGYALTNNHVVQGARSLTVTFDNGGTARATLVGTYPASDLAVIKIDGPVPAYATLGDSNKLKVGERVIAIGSPLGRYTNTVTTGIVSAKNRSLGGFNNLIQTDAPINSGNSGGALVNLAGEVIGINSMVDRSGMGDGAQGLGFAQPSAIAKVVARQLIAGKTVDFPYLGVNLEPAAGGMRIASVEANGGAAKAGLRQGDVIVAVEGQAVDANTSIQTILISYEVGSAVKVDIQRDGQPMTIDVTLGKRPSAG